MPNFALEKAAGGRVAGVDEVGRGPLAGPVVAAAVVFPTGVPRKLAALLDDSKKLTAEQRLVAFMALRASGRAEIGVGAASVGEIHRLNILRSALLAMVRAVARLCPEKVVGEWDQRIELKSVRLGAERLCERIHRRCGRGGAFKQRAAI